MALDLGLEASLVVLVVIVTVLMVVGDQQPEGREEIETDEEALEREQLLKSICDS